MDLQSGGRSSADCFCTRRLLREVVGRVAAKVGREVLCGLAGGRLYGLAAAKGDRRGAERQTVQPAGRTARAILLHRGQVLFSRRCPEVVGSNSSGREAGRVWRTTASGSRPRRAYQASLPLLGSLAMRLTTDGSAGFSERPGNFLNGRIGRTRSEGSLTALKHRREGTREGPVRFRRSAFGAQSPSSVRNRV